MSEQIDMLALGIQDAEQNATEVSGVYEDLLLDEVEHAQILTLQITNMLALAGEEEPSTNADEGEGSVFAARDLTDVKTGNSGGGEGKK